MFEIKNMRELEKGQVIELCSSIWEILFVGPGQFENIAILGDKNRKAGPGMEERAVENKR